MKDLAKYAPKFKFEVKFKIFEFLKKLDKKIFFWKFSEKIPKKYLKTLKIFIFIFFKIFYPLIKYLILGYFVN